MNYAIGPNSAKDGIEFRFADLECVVMRFEVAGIVEIERKMLIHLHGREMRHRPVIAQSKDARKEMRRSFLVPGRYDCVIEFDSHYGHPLNGSLDPPCREA